MDIKITPDGCIGVQVTASCGESGSVWEQRIIQEISARTPYKIVPVQLPGMGAAAGGPGPDIIEMIRISFEVAGYLGALWKSEQYIRRKIKGAIDKSARSYAHQRSYLHIILTNGDPVPGSSLRPLSIRDLVAILPDLREILEGVGGYTLTIMGKSRAGKCINFWGLNKKDLQGRALKRMIKIADSESGPVGYSSEDLNMLIFKPNSRLY